LEILYYRKMQSLLRYTEREFYKGYNDTLKPELLPAGYAADALNCVLENDKIEKRTGYSLVGNDQGSKRGLGLFGYENAAGTKRLVAMFDDAGGANAIMSHWTGSGNWANVNGGGSFTANIDVNFEQGDDLLFTFNGTDSSYKYDGTDASAVAAVPVTKYARWFHNYMFCAGNSSTPSRLYFSNVGDPETWGAGDYIDVNPNDGDVITGLHILGDELIVTKKNRVWVLTGFGSAGFAVTDINERVTGFGNISHRSMANIGNDNLFLSFVGEMPHIRSVQRTRYAVVVAGGIVSDNIEGTLGGVNKTKLDLSACFFDGRRYYLALADGSSTYNNLVLVYDTLNKGFTRWTGLNPAAWAVSTIGGSAEIYFQEASADSKVYKLDTSTNDNTVAIDFQYKTRAFVCRGARGDIKADTKAKWKYLYLTADSGNDVDLLIQSSPDLFTFEDEATVNLTGQSTVLPFTLPQRLGVTTATRERVNIGRNPTHMMQFLFKQAEADKPVTIREYSVLFKPKRLRDA
jgi:hypothetical protein